MWKKCADDAVPARVWFTIILLTAVDAYAFIDASILALLIDPVKRDLGASDLQMGLMLGVAFSALYGIFAVPAGHYVDRFHRTRLIGAASVIWTILTIICGTAHSLTVLLVGRMGIGISEAILMPAIFSIIRDAVPHRKRGIAYAIYGMSPMIGGGLSLWGGAALLRIAGEGSIDGIPLIGALLPWQQTMVAVGLLGLPFSALLLFAQEPARRNDARGMLRGDFVGAARYMIERRMLYLPLLGFAIFSTMLTFGIGIWLPTALSRHLGVAPEAVGSVLGILNFACGLAGLCLTGWTMERIARRGGNPLQLGALLCCVTAIGGAGAVLVPGMTASYVFAGLCAMTMGSSFAIGAAALAEVTDDALMGRVSGLYFLFQNVLGQSLGPVVVALTAGVAFAGAEALSYGLAVSLTAFALLAGASALELGRRIALATRMSG